MKRLGLPRTGVLLLFLVGAASSEAATRTWQPAAGTNDWFSPANWDGGTSVPAAGDDVTVANAGAALLTNSTPYFNSVALSSTLIFSNWDTMLSATNVTIQPGGVMTLPVAFTNNAVSNNVYVVCSNLTIAAGGSINVDYLGWARGMAFNTPGNGPGAAPAYGAAGYGGLAGGQNLTYGSASAPVEPGSGGRHGNNDGWPGGHGGGAVRIEADGTVLVNGIITANGRNAGNYGSLPGSGGGVFVRCYTLAGTNVGANGMISAKGGNCADSSAAGGGRIAVIYTNAAPSTAPILCSAAGGTGPGGNGDIGTLYFSDTNLLVSPVMHSGQIFIPGFTNWSLTSLTVNNGWVRFPIEDFRLDVTNDVTVMGSGRLELGGSVARLIGSYRFIYTDTNGPTLTCGSLTLADAGSLYIYGGRTNSAMAGCGALVNVGGDVALSGTNCWIYPTSHPTNGNSTLFNLRGLTVVSTNSGFNADTRGFAAGITNSIGGWGPGGSFAGASYGGLGGWGTSTYGNVSAPLEPGSGGRTVDYVNRGGNGGGAVRIIATADVALNGQITANGGSRDGYSGGGGSGGGIYIVCNTISGSNGLVSADGGFGQGGSGGGGRIAVIYTNVAAQNAAPVPKIVFSAAGGQANQGSEAGDIGTLYFPDNRFLTETVSHRGQWAVAGFTNWAPNQLTVSNGWIRFNPEGFRLTVTNDVSILGTGPTYHKLELSNGWLSCGGSLTLANASLILYRNPTNGSTLTSAGAFILTNNAVLSIYSGMTNVASPAYGALVDVAGDMRLAGTNCWVYVTAHPTNGGTALFRMRNLLVSSTSGFNASSTWTVARGYAAGPFGGMGYGPGRGATAGGAGGGYGGLGGGANGSYGQTYGSSNAPVDPGSGGVVYGQGGGAVRIQALNIVTLNGTITADGIGRPGYLTCAGSGGAIYIVCRVFAGANGRLSAIGGSNGAPDQGGGGGGGRIAVWCVSDRTTGPTTVAVNGGTGTANGDAGTIVWGHLPAPGTLFVVH